MTGQGQLITGVVVGAGAMYFLDPDSGTRRRALLQEKTGELSQTRRTAGTEQERWSPRIRLILGAAGGLLAVKGLRTRGVGGELLTALGTALLTRAVSNTPPQQLVDLVTDGSSASPPATPPAEAPKATVPDQDEEVTAHASQHRRATKSTKRRRSRP